MGQVFVLLIHFRFGTSKAIDSGLQTQAGCTAALKVKTKGFRKMSVASFPAADVMSES